MLFIKLRLQMHFIALGSDIDFFFLNYWLTQSFVAKQLKFQINSLSIYKFGLSVFCLSVCIQ